MGRRRGGRSQTHPASETRVVPSLMNWVNILNDRHSISFQLENSALEICLTPAFRGRPSLATSCLIREMVKPAVGME